MLGFVVVSHSKKLAEEIINLCNEMKKYEFPVENGSGIIDGGLGSDPMIIKSAIEKAFLEKGVVIFADLGSSVMNSEIAIEFLDESFDKNKVKIADAPIVEGLIMSMAINDEKLTLEELFQELDGIKTMKKVHN
nr:dihydroxyacetone kinase phosphoryl donor subunit DhaM [uncultured Cetobacterium sp.]